MAIVVTNKNLNVCSSHILDSEIKRLQKQKNVGNKATMKLFYARTVAAVRNVKGENDCNGKTEG